MGVVRGNWGDVYLFLLVISKLFRGLFTFYCFPPIKTTQIILATSPELASYVQQADPQKVPRWQAVRTTILLLPPNGFCEVKKLATTRAGPVKVSGQGVLLTSNRLNSANSRWLCRLLSKSIVNCLKEEHGGKTLTICEELLNFRAGGY